MKEKKQKGKKINSFKIIWKYLKDDKKKLYLYMFLVLITYLPQLLNAVFWGFALESLVNNNFEGFILYLVLWEGFFIFFYSILQFPREYLYIYLENKFYNKVSKDLYKKIDSLPAKAFEEMGVGEFINRIYTDPKRVIELIAKLIKMLCKSLVLIVVFIIAFKISIVLFLEIMVFAVVMGFISTKFLPKIKKVQKEIKKESDVYVKVATENLTGIREIKSLGIKHNIEKNIFSILDRLLIQNKKIGKSSILYHSSNNLIFFILQFIILFTCGYYFYIGEISFAIFTMMQMYIWRVDEVVEGISDFGVSYNKVTVSLERIDELINNKLYNDEVYGDINLVDNKGIIEFRDVKFKYSKDEEYTLKGLDLLVEPNKLVAIVGKSGNGKSTIFNLLLRYFDVNEGDILIDGENINDLTEKSLRNNISIIRQAPFLFNLSILDNLRLVKSDATIEEVIEVCKKSYIDDYITSLPKGYETMIGEGGINLSGGQKQRLAIARTLLLKTKIILFDEATSSLDNESQEYIKKTIDELALNHTVIIIAHRLSTIVDADIINVIDKGKLVASGTHKELIAKSSIYSSLYDNEL